MVWPRVLARVRNVPTRLGAAVLIFGGMLGAPALLGVLGIASLAFDVPILGGILLLLAAIAFAGFVVLAWVLIFQARSRLKRAESALYSGDFDSATRDATFVVKTVFRSDYQMAALFVLALAAERLGAFRDAAELFARALDMIPAMAAHGPGRRARALLSAHAAIDFAAAGDDVRAHVMLSRCHAQLGATSGPGVFDALLDDSSMGAIGINSILVELENRRDPRPLAVLASMLVAYRSRQARDVIQIFDRERMSIDHGLAAHERALAERLRDEAARLASGAGPHRSPGAIVREGENVLSGWAALVLP
jgi:hypothetical protein